MAVTYRITAESSLATQAVNVWHFRGPDANRVTEAQASIDALEAFYDELKADYRWGTLTIGRRVVTVDKNPNSVIGTTQTSVTSSGTANAVLAAAAILSLATANIGPRYRGRAYIGPLDQDNIQSDGRSLNVGIANALVSAAVDNLITDLTATDLVVYSRKFNTSEVVTGLSANPIIGIQRRRLT